MVVYLDLIIFNTILVNYLLLKTIIFVFKQQYSRIGLIISLIISVLSLGLFLISNRYLLLIRYFIGFIIGEIAFIKSVPGRRFVMVTTFYFLNFGLIGTLVIFQIKSSWLLIISLGYIIGLYLFDKVALTLTKHQDWVYNVYFKGNKKVLKAFLDSGNQSYFQGIPVVYVDQKHFNQSFNPIGKIKVTTLNDNVEMKVYDGDDLIIADCCYLVYYSFTKLERYDMILHIDIGGKNV